MSNSVSFFLHNPVSGMEGAEEKYQQNLLNDLSCAR